MALLPAVVFLGLLTWATLGEGGAPAPGDDAPSFEAELLVGDGTLSLAELHGKPVVLNFWASWCAPCEDEAPMLQAAHETYGDEVAFVGVDIKDARSDAIEFVDRYGLEFPHVRDESLEIYTDYALTGQPETFFVDAEGKIVEHIPGTLNEQLLNSIIGEMLQDG